MAEKFSLSPDLGPNLIIPVLLLLPLFLSLVRSIVFHLFAFKPRSWRESFLFGLSTMFVCSENDFHYRNEENNVKDSIKVKVIAFGDPQSPRKQNWLDFDFHEKRFHLKQFQKYLAMFF